MLCSTKVAIAMTPVLHPSFLSERITPRLLTEAGRAGLLSRAPVKSSFIGVPQWHLLAPTSEPGHHLALFEDTTWQIKIVCGKKPFDHRVDHLASGPGPGLLADSYLKVFGTIPLCANTYT